MGLLRSLSLTFVAQVACQAIGVATSFLLVSVLDPGDKGPFDWVVNVPFLLMSLSNLGFATAITYLGGSGQVAPQRLASLGLFLGLTIGTLAAVCAFPILDAVRAEHMPTLPVELLALSLLAAPLLLVRSYLNSILLVANRVGRYNLVEVVLPASFLLLFVGFVVLPGEGARGGVVVRGVLCRLGAIGLSVGTVLALTSYLVRLRPRFDRRVLRRSWRHARWAYGISSATELNQRFGFIVLVPVLLGARLASNEELRTALGLLGASIAFADLLRTLPLAVEPILFRTLASGEDARRITPVVCRNLLVVSVLAALGVAALAPLVILLLNDTYLPCLPTLYLLLPGATLFSVAKTLHADLMGRGRMDLVFWNTLASFLGMTGLNILLIPWFGIEGAGVAMGIAYAAQAAGAVFLYRRHQAIPLGQLLCPQREDVVLYRDALRKVLRRRQPLGSP